MARTWLIDSRGIARKVKNATQLSSCQIAEWSTEAKRQCPNCNYEIDNSDVSTEWPGLPAGVKFDPSDVELLKHLAGKVGYGNAKPHLFIDEFIPTLDGKDGICFTHPENLPGIKKDGSSVHFFHRTTNAYNTGHRKRRKIHMGCDLTAQVRWHKTGKTKPVIENGVQKGCKKIMVLYSSSSKGNKADKANWVMHQYHLGTEDDEKDGEFVVSKVFYQHGEKNSSRSKGRYDVGKEATNQSRENMDDKTLEASPRTPKTSTPNPPRLGKHSLFEDGDERETHCCLLPVQEDVGSDAMWWFGESQAVDEPDDALLDKSLFCDEILEAYSTVQELGLEQPLPLTELNDVKIDFEKEIGVGSSIVDLDDMHLGTLPDLADLQFGSQESIMSWLDRL
ncbi:SUPPRESSOR OF GAMMA RESPONSE 1-like [Nymphaea colorata]|nr:SUPPRESSOR OF GAMMA RESPONSE 1-like [Nymphaea colorata]